jgi:glycosyltransferase involved in cell wall biosynthesis
MKAVCNGYRYTDFITGSNNSINQLINPFSDQTLKKADDQADSIIWVTYSINGTKITPASYNAANSDTDTNINIPVNLLEKMTWAILARPDIDLLIQPFHVKIETELPEITDSITSETLKKTAETGFIAVFTEKAKNRISNPGNPADFLKKAFKHKVKSACFSRPLYETIHSFNAQEKKSHKLKKYKNLAKDKIRTSFSPEMRMYMKNLVHLIRPENPFNTYPSAEPDVAVKKSWEPAMPDISIAVNPAPTGERIPVLMAMHWLEVSGAERFAIELVRHLPKDRYAVYLITDVASENPWEHLVSDHVEEIFHLPDFLDRNIFKTFYVSFLESRKIRLVHINHAPEFYRSLAHIRRFNRKVKIMDSLYIIELPPIPGGYPDFSGRFAEPFIDMHHVACIQIRDYLSQKWLVPEDRMTLIYLNVDADEFNPEKITAGDTRKRYGIPESACLVAFLGRFVEQKRPLVFVETVARLAAKLPENDNTCFIMAGSGYLDEKVRERIRKLGLEDRIILTGNISELKSFYRDIDILVMPSANEGVALVTFESMAMETPLVFADVGAQSELLPPELLVPDCRDEKELAEKFAETCLPFIMNPQKRTATGKMLRKHILEHHTDRMTYSDFEKLYDMMCSDHEQAIRKP